MKQRPEEQTEAIFQAWLSAFADGEEPSTAPYLALAQAEARPLLLERFESFRRTHLLLSKGHEQLLPGRQLGGFRLIRVLGRGGMGSVWEAEELQLHRRVALKVLPPLACLAPRAMERFQREAISGAKVPHHGVVRVLASSVTDGVHWIAQELVGDGRTLADNIAEWREAQLQRGPEQHLELAAFFAQVAEAVGAAHEVGIVHRDLKPSNILLTHSGRPKIADFGLARNDALHSVTRSLGIVGTAPYLSPEQLDDTAGRVQETSDVFALGVTLYEALTFVLPFQGDHPEQVARKTLHHEPVPPSEHRSRIPKDLETICLKALEKSPSRRYPNAASLGRDLRRFLAGEPIHAHRPRIDEQVVKWATRRPWRAVSLALLVVALAGVIGLWIRSQAATSRAERALGAMDRALLQAQSFVDLLSPMDLTSDMSQQQVAILSKQQRFILSDLSGRPEMQVPLLHGTGHAFLWLEEYGLALDALEHASRLMPPDASPALKEHGQLLLGWAMGRSGRHIDAIPILEEVVASTSQDEKAALRRQWAKNRLGQALLHTSMERITQTVDGPVELTRRARDDPDALRATDCFESVDAALNVLGARADHPLRLLNLLDLGIARSTTGLLDEAQMAYKEAQSAYLSSFGPEHPELVYVSMGMARVAECRDDVDAAIELHRSAFRLSRSIHGEEHPTTMEAMCHLARCYGRNGYLSECRQLHDGLAAGGHPDPCMAKLRSYLK